MATLVNFSTSQYGARAFEQFWVGVSDNTKVCSKLKKLSFLESFRAMCGQNLVGTKIF